MLLKRKRSNSEISESSGSFLSNPSPRNIAELLSSPPSVSPVFKSANAPYLSSRTRKRYRDNRPSEAKIHEHTLSILYSAQKNQQPSHKSSQATEASILTATTIQQTSLHSYWSLPSRTPGCCSSDVGASSLSLTTIFQAVNCEDCETPLVSEDGNAMDVDMDFDAEDTALNYACSKCEKLVCHKCAISILGSDRRCLICAGKRTWVGGTSWIDQN